MKLSHILPIAAMAICAACGGDDNKQYIWPDPDPAPSPDPTPETPDEAKPFYVWIDAAGNFEQFANSQDNIKAELDRIKDCGFTDVIVDVRPTTGDVLFKSTVADPVTKMDVWGSSGYVWAQRTADWDYLQTFVDYGHKIGLKVNASINTFVGGYLCPYSLGSEGTLFRDASRKQWATVVNTANGLKNTMDLLNTETDWGAKFFNPANPEAQAYVIGILSDLAKYDLDGIVLDRCRFSDDGLQADFSDESLQQFELYAGQTISDFPGSIIKPGGDSLADGAPFIKQWLAFRAKVIHDFIVDAREAVKAVNPNIRFGVYVGAWYSSYYTSGVNWASPDYNPATEYPSWANADYRNYGYADHCDFMFIGAYASSQSIYGNSEWTMQGFCKLAGQKIKGAAPYAGGPDIGNASGWVDGKCSAILPNAIDACYGSSDGGMFIFDLCHIRMFDYWSAVKKGIQKAKS